jgi:hypothetical protein
MDRRDLEQRRRRLRALTQVNGGSLSRFGSGARGGIGTQK